MAPYQQKQPEWNVKLHLVERRLFTTLLYLCTYKCINMYIIHIYTVWIYLLYTHIYTYTHTPLLDTASMHHFVNAGGRHFHCHDSCCGSAFIRRCGEAEVMTPRGWGGEVEWWWGTKELGGRVSRISAHVAWCRCILQRDLLLRQGLIQCKLPT